MRKLLLIATLSLGTFAVAQTAGSNFGDTQSANNDWYNQRLAAAVQMYSHIGAAVAPSSESQKGVQPESMASNTGSQEDWYNQKLAAAVQQYSSIEAATAPSTTTFQ